MRLLLGKGFKQCDPGYYVWNEEDGCILFALDNDINLSDKIKELLEMALGKINDYYRS